MGCSSSKVVVYSDEEKAKLEIAKTSAQLLASDESLHEQHDDFKQPPDLVSVTRDESPRDGAPAPKLNAPPPKLSMRAKSQSFGTIDLNGDASKNRYSSSRKLDTST